MIIGMLGWISSGKGTAANILTQECGFVEESFASPLKDATATVFGWPRELLEGDTDASRAFREKPCPFWSKELGRTFTPREALQQVGTDVFRDNFYQDIWVAGMKKRLAKHIEDGTNVVISDVRFRNELDALKKLGATFVWTRRGELPEWYDTAVSATRGDCEGIVGVVQDECDYLMREVYKIHRSEWDWCGYPVDHVIYNDGTLEELVAKVAAVYQLERNKIGD